MKNVKLVSTVIGSLLGLISCTYLLFTPSVDELSPLTIWFDEPADASQPDSADSWKDDAEWIKSLPLGNGSLGAMVFGDVNRERIQLNEESMWSGSPVNCNRPTSPNQFDKIRELLFRNRFKEANLLAEQTMVCLGNGSAAGRGTHKTYGSFQTLGDLWLDFGRNSGYTNYRRSLDLETATATVSYQQDGITFKREIFTSYPDQVLVIRITANKKGAISVSGTLTRPERYTTSNSGNELSMTGALSNGKGGSGLRYLARVRPQNKGGKLTFSEKEFQVEKADELVILLAASTDYRMSAPDYRGRDYVGLTRNRLDEAAEKGFEQLKENHLTDYQTYFNRVQLDLHPAPAAPMPTDDRLSRFRQSPDDPHLAELLFQYGRYLLISSSRPGSLPANLQGIWTNKTQSAWNSDYHAGINLQMNYWPAEVTNLSEMHHPLFDLLESLTIPGRQTASEQYGLPGWVMHPLTNVWGYTSPGESLSWGMNNVSGAWLCQHIAEHYAFTSDRRFLERMYPVVRGSAEFFLNWLVEDPQTRQLVSGPSTSPENTYVGPCGEQMQISMAPAHDQQVIRQLFADFLRLSTELSIADELTEAVADAKMRLAGTKISADGRLLEWSDEFEETDPGHRHLSHLFALHPGNQIAPDQTPELAAAARRSLDYRVANGTGYTGWSAAWLVSQYARLNDGDKAWEMLTRLIAKRTSSNLLGKHPPFQIDTNFGATAGIAEMLLQSHTEAIEFLPALPAAWPSGSVSGLKARGGFTVDLEWNAGRLTKARIYSPDRETVLVKYGDQKRYVSLNAGETVELLDV